MEQSKLHKRLTELQEEMQDLIKDELTIFKRKFKVHAEYTKLLMRLGWKPTQ